MAMSWKAMTLSGWGRATTASVLACRPERVSDVRARLAETGPEALIVHAGGRSYGDAALNDGGRALLTRRLDRLLAFDPDSGELAAESGVTFETLLTVFLPRGFLVPVTPGTAFVTLGGAVANDVHGKNHDRTGSFGDHVLWLDLMLPDGAVLRVSPRERPALFAATVGGLGLTGVILAVAFRLVRVPSPAVELHERPVADLDGFLDTLQRSRATATYSVGWIDALARGRRLGRGIVETAEPAPSGIARPAPRRRVVPCDLPRFVLNPATVGLFNEFYYRRVPAGGRSRTLSYDRFLYPLDSLLRWNRIYGRRGFYQFQCVLPDESAAVGLRALLETVAGARAASFLAVLKTLGGEGRGYLSFARRGFTLALDFPRGAGIAALLARLERLTLDHGGRVYLAKDACLTPQGFAAMYPRLREFRAVLADIDPAGRLASDLARRLRIRESDA
jgi:decaprenylphospho-beta-D-ribofuranose 2-oxidase